MLRILPQTYVNQRITNIFSIHTTHHFRLQTITVLSKIGKISVRSHTTLRFLLDQIC